MIENDRCSTISEKRYVTNFVMLRIAHMDMSSSTDERNEKYINSYSGCILLP